MKKSSLSTPTIIQIIFIIIIIINAIIIVLTFPDLAQGLAKKAIVVGSFIVVGLVVYVNDRIDKRLKRYSHSPGNPVKTGNSDTTIAETDEDILSPEKSAYIISSTNQEYLPQIVKLEEENAKQNKKIIKIVEYIYSQQVKINELESTVNNQKDEISKVLKSYEQDIYKIRQDVDEIRELNLGLQKQSKDQGNPAQFPLTNQSQVVGSASLSEPSNVPISRELQEIVDKFNQGNKDHFTYLNPKFLKLNPESLYAKPNAGASPIVRLVPCDDSNESYLKIQIDEENWLLPNLNSSYFQKIMKDLNPSIFNVNSTSDLLKKLVKPAKLKDAGSGIWEIAKRGEFI